MREYGICKYCKVDMKPGGSSLTEANGWMCEQCGHEEVESGSWKLAGEPCITLCQCVNCENCLK